MEMYKLYLFILKSMLLLTLWVVLIANQQCTLFNLRNVNGSDQFLLAVVSLPKSTTCSPIDDT